MDAVNEFLVNLRRHGYARGNFLGLLNVLIGRRVEDAHGTVISIGLTWRDLAGWLKKVRWDRDAVRELGLDPKQLPPRDRERFWYTAIAQARVDSTDAAQAGDRLARILAENGYRVIPGPK